MNYSRLFKDYSSSNRSMYKNYNKYVSRARSNETTIPLYLESIGSSFLFDSSIYPKKVAAKSNEYDYRLKETTQSMESFLKTADKLNQQSDITKLSNYYSANNKYYDNPTEFTNGYDMKLPEIVIIVLILICWILSLRKFVKNFDKIRTTHYREIPYKYKIKDPQNINQVRAVDQQIEAVVYTNDTAKMSLNGSNETSVDASAIRAEDAATALNGERLNRREYNRMRRFNDEKKYQSNTDLFSIDLECKRNRIYDKEQSLSLTNLDQLNCDRNSDFDYGSDNQQARIYIRKPSSSFVDYSESISEQLALPKTSKLKRDSRLLNPELISPLIKQSLLELHQKSIENIAAAAAAADQPMTNKRSNKKDQREKTKMSSLNYKYDTYSSYENSLKKFNKGQRTQSQNYNSNATNENSKSSHSKVDSQTNRRAEAKTSKSSSSQKHTVKFLESPV
jgi:hypothetical protein